MKFAKRVFLGAGIWGVVVLTPLYFLFDAIGRQGPSPINYPQFYYGFLAVALAWQFGFLVIGTDPARFRWLMLPSIVEKLGYCLTLGVLYLQGRITYVDALVIPPDLVLGVLFVAAFAKTSGS